MQALDQMLEGDEPFVQELAEAMGNIAAEQFVDEFNNGCVHLDGFEEFVQRMDTTNIFYAPLASLSNYADH